MSIKIINDEGRVWCVRIVTKGERYGLDMCLTHDDDKPVVEFYDCRYEHTIFGQFVSRYYVHTLLESGNRGGLDLCGYEPSWKISQKGMDRIRDFLRTV